MGAEREIHVPCSLSTCLLRVYPRSFRDCGDRSSLEVNANPRPATVCSLSKPPLPLFTLPAFNRKHISISTIACNILHQWQDGASCQLLVSRQAASRGRFVIVTGIRTSGRICFESSKMAIDFRPQASSDSSVLSWTGCSKSWNDNRLA